MNTRHLLALTLPLLQACVHPAVVHYYDENCQVMAKKMVLDAKSLDALDKCNTESCKAEFLGALVTVAASTVISGSIVIVGNVVYSLQKDKACKKAGFQRHGEIATPASGSASQPEAAAK